MRSNTQSILARIKGSNVAWNLATNLALALGFVIATLTHTR